MGWVGGETEREAGGEGETERDPEPREMDPDLLLLPDWTAAAPALLLEAVADAFLSLADDRSASIPLRLRMDVDAAADEAESAAVLMLLLPPLLGFL